LIQKNALVVPIEVKSGHKGRMKSMKIFKDAYKPKQAIKISQAMYNDEHEVLELPLYAVEYLIKPKA
jgi:hypothetical protein